jgi:hypothetical protein
MAASGFTPISLYYSATAAAVPLAANLTAGELSLNTADGKLYYKNSSNVVTLLASTAGSSGDVVGPASATDNALARFDLTTGKLIQNSVGILSDAGVLTGLTGLTSSGSITLSSLTSGRVPYASTGGLLVDSANMTFNGTSLTLASDTTVPTLSVLGNSATPNLRLGSQGNTSVYWQIGRENASTGDFIFSTQTAERVRFTDAGRVGIGTSSPTAGKFQVSGTASSVGIAITGTAASADTGLYVSTDAITGSYKPINVYTSATTGITAVFENLANVSTSDSTVSLAVASGSAGDAKVLFTVGGVGGWATGLDNSDSDKFKLSFGSTLGTNDYVTVDTSGNVGIGTTSPTSGLQTAGSSSKSAFKTPNIAEVDTISATAATGTINYDVTTQSVLYYTSNASGNWTLNFRGSSGTTLNAVMQTGESISATFLVTNGSTAYYNSAVTIDGTSVTPKWQGGSAPTSGNASSTDCYTYVIQKTGSATYVVLASQTKFA